MWFYDVFQPPVYTCENNAFRSSDILIHQAVEPLVVHDRWLEEFPPGRAIKIFVQYMNPTQLSRVAPCFHIYWAYIAALSFIKSTLNFSKKNKDCDMNTLINPEHFITCINSHSKKNHGRSGDMSRKDASLQWILLL